MNIATFANIIRRHHWLIVLFFVTCGGCKKFVTVNPPATSLVSQSVYQNSNTAAAAVAGIYQQMSSNCDLFGQTFNGNVDFTSLAGVSADEFTLYPTSVATLSQAYTNSLSPALAPVPFWSSLYSCIYQSNEAVTALSDSTFTNTALRRILLGEAKFSRALCYFYLVNIFGDVPLTTTTDYRVNTVLSRTHAAQVYQQVISDLRDAQSLLPVNYVTPTGASSMQRTLPNQGAATALLARAYLYIGKYDSAELEASSTISNKTSYHLVSLDSAFLMNNNEAILQLQPVLAGDNTPDGYTYVLSSGPNASFNSIYLSAGLLAAFEANDNRKTKWVGSYTGGGTTYNYAYKYKVALVNAVVSEYYTVLRLAEQYLIRAEARARQNTNLPGAIEDLNVIRERAGLPDLPASLTQAQVIAAVMQERRIELFAELGHRWLDLKRTGSVDSVMSVVTPLKGGGAWNTTAQLFPIPNAQILVDPNLSQNPGYSK